MNVKPDMEKRKEIEEMAARLNVRNDVRVKKIGTWKK